MAEQLADVLLLAAGFGKRMRPLTDSIPKPLLCVDEKPLIVWNIERLKQNGFTDLIVNTHYLSEAIREALGDGSAFGVTIRYSHEETILDTGGAVAQIQPMRRRPLLLTVNSDSLFGPSFSFADLIAAHQGFGDALATMTLRRMPDGESFTALGVDRENRVVSFLGAAIREKSVVENMMFAGVQVLDERIGTYLEPAGSVFSITSDTLVRALEAQEVVRGFRYDGWWSDVGTPERYAEAKKTYSKAEI